MKLTEKHVGKWVGRTGSSPLKVLFVGQEYAVVKNPLGQEICTRNTDDWVCVLPKKKERKGQKILLAQAVFKNKSAGLFLVHDALFLSESDADKFAKTWRLDLVKFPAGPWIEVEL